MTTRLFGYIQRIDLFNYLIISKLKLGEKDMMLGYLWWILDPIILMFIYWVLIGVIFQRGGPDYPLFILCGLMPFRAFATSVSQSVTSISSKFSVIAEINFPRIFLPLTDVIVNHIKLLFGLIVVIILAIFFGIKPNYRIVYLLLPFCIQIIIVSGIAMFLSIAGVYFRDIKNLMQFVIRILLYMSPILYSVERIPEKFRAIYILNPLASLIMLYRDLIMSDFHLNFRYLAISLISALLIFGLGYVLFIRNERQILKYI